MGTSSRRLLLGALLALVMTVALVPGVASAQLVPPDADDTADDPKCQAGEQLVDGECVAITCTPSEEPIGEGGACEKPPLVSCWDGVDRPRGTCPAQPQQAPCPDGSEVCGTIRACPTDTPLPPGATCDDPLPSAPPPPPPLPAPSRVGAGTLGRPADVQAANVLPRRVARPSIPRGPEPLARTGQPGWLTVLGVGLVAAGWSALRLSRSREGARE